MWDLLPIGNTIGGGGEEAVEWTGKSRAAIPVLDRRRNSLLFDKENLLMATATLFQERTRTPQPAAFLPPPPLPPRRRIRIGAGGDDPEERDWIEEREKRWEEEANGETAFGCDYSDGPLSPTGCRW